MHRGSGPISRNVGAEDEEGVVLQREMGLVSGISLIVGRTTVQLIVSSEQSASVFLKYYNRNNCGIRNMADCGPDHVGIWVSYFYYVHFTFTIGKW